MIGNSVEIDSISCEKSLVSNSIKTNNERYKDLQCYDFQNVEIGGVRDVDEIFKIP
jgi:hypothetical protein